MDALLRIKHHQTIQPMEQAASAKQIRNMSRKSGEKFLNTKPSCLQKKLRSLQAKTICLLGILSRMKVETGL